MSGTRDAISVVDLFCGAGGLSLGLRHAGFNVVHSVDHFDAAVSTYRHNLGSHIVDAEITGAMDLPSAQVIAGGERKEESIRLRATTGEKERWTKAAKAAGRETLSGWLRFLANQAAGK